MFLKIARDKKEQIVNLKEELKWLAGMSRQYKKEIFAVTLVSVLSSIFSLTTSLCLKYVIDAVTGASKASVLYIAILAVTLMLCRIGFSAVSSRIRVRISVKIQNELQIKVYRTIFNAQWESLREYRKGDLINRLNSDVSEVSNGVINWWPNVLTVLTQFIYAFVLIVMNDPAMAFIALMSAPVSAFMSRFMITTVYDEVLHKIETMSVGDIDFQALNDVHILKTSMLFKDSRKGQLKITVINDKAINSEREKLETTQLTPEQQRVFNRQTIIKHFFLSAQDVILYRILLSHYINNQVKGVAVIKLDEIHKTYRNSAK